MCCKWASNCQVSMMSLKPAWRKQALGLFNAHFSWKGRVEFGLHLPGAVMFGLGATKCNVRLEICWEHPPLNHVWWGWVPSQNVKMTIEKDCVTKQVQVANQTKPNTRNLFFRPSNISTSTVAGASYPQQARWNGLPSTWQPKKDIERKQQSHKHQWHRDCNIPGSKREKIVQLTVLQLEKD